MSPQLIYFLLFYLLLLVVGFAIAKQRLIIVAWILALLAPAVAFTMLFSVTPPLKMFAFIVATLAGMKVVVTANYYRHEPFGLTFFQWLAFVAGWVGMKPQPFEKLPGQTLGGAASLIKKGFINLFLGGVVIAVAHFIIRLPNQWGIFSICSALLLVGVSLILHFGMLAIIAGLWRLLGAETYLLFRQPLRSTRLAEFWGRRWNVAFIEMLSIAVLKPLKNKLGKQKAVIASFIVSGLLHELAISLPVGAGFGGPTLYFIIQGGAVLAEKRLESTWFFLKCNPVVARIWMFFWLIVPVPLLFHIPFLKQIVWPLAGL